MCTDLKIEEGNICEVFHLEKKTKMPYKMFQHLTHTSDLPHMDFTRLKKRVIIEGMTDGQTGGPSNIEQPTMVHKKKLKKNNDHGIIILIGVPSHISEVLIHKK